jgi:hypothetical protein
VDARHLGATRLQGPAVGQGGNIGGDGDGRRRGCKVLKSGIVVVKNMIDTFQWDGGLSESSCLFHLVLALITNSN